MKSGEDVASMELWAEIGRDERRRWGVEEEG